MFAKLELCHCIAPAHDDSGYGFSHQNTLPIADSSHIQHQKAGPPNVKPVINARVSGSRLRQYVMLVDPQVLQKQCHALSV
jgi:hypothetical protein